MKAAWSPVAKAEDLPAVPEEVGRAKVKECPVAPVVVNLVEGRAEVPVVVNLVEGRAEVPVVLNSVVGRAEVPVVVNSVVAPAEVNNVPNP